MGVCKTNNKINHTILNKNIENDPDYILPIEYSIRKSISEDYKMDSNFIGRGASGEVYIAQNKKGKKFAIKTINKSHIKFKECIISEVKISLSLNHPHIVKCYNVYEDLKSISFVLELIEGGDLFDFIKKYPAEHLDDDIALEILIQILEILNYLHNELRVCHRDIKLENFLITIIHDKPKIKIIDFGLSCYIPENNFMNDFVGTLHYQAPEILERVKYSKMIDMWSTGILFYIMLLGYFPFNSNDTNQLEDMILYQNIDFSVIQNKDLRELCEGLLEKHPDFRLSAIKALDKACCIYEKICSDDSYLKIRDDFLKIDTKKLGYVTWEQVDLFYKNSKLNFDKYKKSNKVLNFSDFANLIYGIIY